MELVGGSFDQCRSSLLYDDGKGVRTLLLTLIGLKVCYASTSLQCIVAFVFSHAIQINLQRN